MMCLHTTRSMCRGGWQRRCRISPLGALHLLPEFVQLGEGCLVRHMSSCTAEPCSHNCSCAHAAPTCYQCSPHMPPSACARMQLQTLMAAVTTACCCHHRVSRAGRAGDKGMAITFIGPEEERYAPELVKALHESGADATSYEQDMSHWHALWCHNMCRSTCRCECVTCIMQSCCVYHTPTH